jgi:hypothetical protein
VENGMMSKEEAVPYYKVSCYGICFVGLWKTEKNLAKGLPAYWIWDCMNKKLLYSTTCVDNSHIITDNIALFEVGKKKLVEMMVA